MDLHLLRETPHTTVYYDADNEWLFLDWCGELTLSLVQENCLLAAECLLERPCTRMLNSSQNVTGLTLNVPVWLYKEYRPLLHYTGVEYMAWVYAPNLLLKPFFDKLVARFEVPVVTMFDDVESAAKWLQHTRFHYLHNPFEQRPAVQHSGLAI